MLEWPSYARALEAWAMGNEVDLCFIRPGHPVENGFIESFNGRLREECLNVEWFSSLEDARQKLAKFREHYNQQRPHTALADRTPEAFAALHREKASTLLGRLLVPRIPLESGLNSRLYDFVMATSHQPESRAMQIGEIAKRTCLTVDAIRFYEKRKLLPKAVRSAGRFRLYGELTIERLHFIQQMQRLGFSHREVGELIQLRDRKVDACESVRELLMAKLVDLGRSWKSYGIWSRSWKWICESATAN